MKHIAVAVLVLAMKLASSTCAQQCQPFWTGVESPVISTHAHRMTIFDDGDGSMLYVSGSVMYTPSQSGPGVARWNGRWWELLESGYPASSHHGPLHVLDLGVGPRLFASGVATSPHQDWWFRVWDGQQWQPVPLEFASMDHGWPKISVDHGDGPVVYGLHATSAQSNMVVRWENSKWMTIAVLNRHASRLAEFDDGTGAKLYITGSSFTQLNGMPYSRIARWTGHAWEPVGSGIGSGFTASDMIVHDDGRGPALYIADVTSAGGIPINRIARWDGKTWSDVGGGGIMSTGITAVHVLGSMTDASGPSLFAGGYISMAGGGVPVRRIARYWNGVWDDMGGGIPGSLPRAMVAFDDGRGPSLFVGGAFHIVGSGAPGAVQGIAQWVGCPNQCYADCDNSSTHPRLNIDDFTCFVRKFAYGDPYVDCNQDGQRNIDDFTCFINRFAAGCE